MSNSTIISVLLGVFLTLSLGYQVYSAATAVADNVQDRQSTTLSAMFGE